jgi:hypothetical protein
LLATTFRCIFILFLIIKLLREVTMNKLKIPENHSGVSKTLRLPENIADDVQNLANLKNLSFNKTIITLLEFSLSNLEEDDRLKLDKMRK